MMAAHAMSQTSSTQQKASVPTPVIIAYAAFAFVALVVYHVVADGEFSAILTLSVMVQCLGVSFLCMQVLSKGSASGISAGSLILDAFAFGFRLSSTTWLNGYLPVDESGEHVYQIVDMCSLAMVLWLLYRIYGANRDSYQASEDSFPVAPTVLACLALAALFHGDMNDRPIFDTLWMAGLFAGVFSVMPQLALILKTGGRAEALTCHYMAALALSRVLSGIFMWYARFDITCVEMVSGFNHTVFSILGAHLVHLLLLSDFGYYYVRAVMQKGLSEPVELSGAEWV
jgi:hypothetical protein